MYYPLKYNKPLRKPGSSFFSLSSINSLLGLDAEKNVYVTVSRVADPERNYSFHCHMVKATYCCDNAFVEKRSRKNRIFLDK